AQAAKAYAELPLGGESEEFAAKLRLKTGQAQLKAKRYQEAEETFRGIIKRGAAGPVATEASYWLAKSLDKAGKNDQAYEIYLRLAQLAAGGAFADDALLDAAYLKRYQKKWDEALQLFKKYLALQPEAKQSATVLWEAAWSSYQSRDYQGA